MDATASSRDPRDPWVTPSDPLQPRDRADPWGTPPAAPAAGPPFDRASAEKAIRAIDLRQCLAGRTHQATGSLRLVFAPTGRVLRTEWNDPTSAAREENACVMGIVAMVKVPAFGGTRATVSAAAAIDGEKVTWSVVSTTSP
jgi:hypothetical protein